MKFPNNIVEFIHNDVKTCNMTYIRICCADGSWSYSTACKPHCIRFKSRIVSEKFGVEYVLGGLGNALVT